MKPKQNLLLSGLLKLAILNLIAGLVAGFAGAPRSSRAQGAESSSEARKIPIWVENFQRELSANQARTEEFFSKPQEIVGLELVIANGATDAFYSRFGHALLRLVTRQGVTDPYGWWEDPMVSFVAIVADQDINNWKGLTGAYPVMAQFQPFSKFWTRYVAQEIRSLDRYIIPTTPELRADFMKAFERFARDEKTRGSYTFLDRNCGRVLAEVFEAAKLVNDELGKVGPLRPSGLPDFFADQFIRPYPVLQVESPRPVVEKAAALLDIPLDALHFGQGWPADAAARLLGGMNEREVKVLLQQTDNMPIAVFRALNERYNYRGQPSSDLNQALGFKSVDASFYDLCSDLACAEALVAKARQTWPESTFLEMVRLNRDQGAAARHGLYAHHSPHQEYWTHVKWLAEAGKSIVLPAPAKTARRSGRP